MEQGVDYAVIGISYWNQSLDQRHQSFSYLYIKQNIMFTPLKALLAPHLTVVIWSAFLFLACACIAFLAIRFLYRQYRAKQSERTK